MKQPIKRITALFLAVLMGILSFGNYAVTASAEETENTDAYVLAYDSAVEGYEYGSYPYMYKSPFQMHHAYSDPAAGAGSVWDYYYTNEIFHLINTTKLSQGGEGAFASIPVYCTDADTSTTRNSNYRRINLEDSTYHESGAAARLRTVILSSFPYVQDMSEISENANIWLEQNGKPALQNLQIGEAMLATQQAIWEITHGEKYTILDPLTGMDTYDGSNAVYTINAEETMSESSESNITGLYEYLLSLEGNGPMDLAVSEASFRNLTYESVKEEDGTYSVTVSFELIATIDSDDNISLTATCAEETAEPDRNENGSYSVVFSNLSEPKEVTVEVTGTQTGGDVYLFDAVGDRGSAQSMIGYDNSTLPIYGKAVATPDRVVNIYKTTSDDTGKMPLANIQFDIYLAATMSDLESGKVILGEHPSQTDIAAYQKTENHIVTLTTDVNGFASYNFTENGHPDGVYLVMERDNPATIGSIEPFFLILPGTMEDGSGYSYTVTVNPKNVTETGPDIKKDVTEIENNHDTFHVGQVHTWIIRGGVPAGLATAQEYVITDTLDYRLTYVQGSPVVKLYTRAGNEILLEKDIHYVLNEGKKNDGEYTVDHFAISLTESGMEYAAQNLDSGEAIPEIRVYFDAKINSYAAMGQEIPNQAHLDYENSAGVDYDADSDVPEVHTGGINILKTDVDGKKLAGATFKIAREATQAELKDETIRKETITVGDNKLQVVFEAFYGTQDLSGEKVSQITTDENGKALMYGLAYGTYYIVETKAPAGFNLLTSPVRVTVSKYSHLTAVDQVYDDAEKLIDNTIRVINTRYVLPETGGIGTTVFTVTGLTIISSAALLILMNGKKRHI